MKQHLAYLIAGIAVALSSGRALALDAYEPPCRPFRVFRGAELPPPPTRPLAKITRRKDWESSLTARLEAATQSGDFIKAYANWSKNEGHDLDDDERYELLVCLDHYVSMDLDKDGLQDWTAVVDGRLTTVLAPAEDDMDGDGLVGAFDPHPLTPDVSRPGSGVSHVPDHLRGPADAERELLLRRFGILAIDHSDAHAPSVLTELMDVFAHGLPASLPAKLSGLRYLYAFAGHDTTSDIAAYHPGLRALSIGGQRSYGVARRLPNAVRLEVITSLAHEIAHAFVFDCLSPAELWQAAERFGGWREERSDLPANDFYAARFFREYPAGTLSPREKAARSMVSNYSRTNVHEWFAEAFASYVLHRLSQGGHLGATPTTRIANDISSELIRWLDERLAH